MGLDMYLRAKKHVSGYDLPKNEDKELYFKLKSDFNADNFVDPETPFAVIQFIVGYWRKANAIHRWFVNNIQNGDDDCGEYHVSREDLKQLKCLCIEVLEDNSKAMQLLPPSSGFFFGSTDIDEWYLSDLKYTVDIIEKLENHLPDSWEIQYSSSW